MTKVMRYENGKAIAGQVDAPFKVDWSDWINMTDAQKKGKKWLIENVPGAEGEIDAELFTPLWTNPNPTAAFAAQQITLASDDYDFLLALYYVSTSDVRTCSVIAPKGEAILLGTSATGAGGSISLNRTCAYNSATVFSMGNATRATGTTAGSSDNTICIPLAIYGFKKTVKIKFDALAKDVSTLASKCMMPDGETSVKDLLEPLYSDTYTGTGYNFTLDIYKDGRKHIYGNINLSNVSASTYKTVCNINHTVYDVGFSTFYPGNTSFKNYGYLLLHNQSKVLYFCPSAECNNVTVELRLNNWF